LSKQQLEALLYKHQQNLRKETMERFALRINNAVTEVGLTPQAAAKIVMNESIRYTNEVILRVLTELFEESGQ